MYRTTLFVLACLLGTLSVGLPASPPGQSGVLFLVGGGSTTERIQERILQELGERTRIVVLPQASSAEGRGAGSVAMWRAAGASSVLNLERLDDPETLRELERADLIWMPGGSQTKLMEALRAADLLSVIRERHQAGAALGGTSAGAAVAGTRMIGGSPDPEALRGAAMDGSNGLGVWPQVVVDQHFVARKRNNRLLTTVLDHPELLGVGIDESTLVIVRGTRMSVLGRGCVLVYDARGAEVAPVEKGEPQAAIGLRLHVLRDGMSWSWDPR